MKKKLGKEVQCLRMIFSMKQQTQPTDRKKLQVDHTSMAAGRKSRGCQQPINMPHNNTTSSFREEINQALSWTWVFRNGNSLAWCIDSKKRVNHSPLDDDISKEIVYPTQTL